MNKLFVNHLMGSPAQPDRFSEFAAPAEAGPDGFTTGSYAPGFALLQQGRFEVVVNGRVRHVAGPAFVAFKLYAHLSATAPEDQPKAQLWRVGADYLETLKHDEPFSVCPLDASLKAARRAQRPVPILQVQAGEFAVSCAESVLGWETLTTIDGGPGEETLSYLLWRASRPRPAEIASELVGLAIIGAGPAGLSLAAWAQEQGISYRMFGEPLSFWKRHIPPLPLRSPPVATNLSSPRPGQRYLDFAERHGVADAPKVEMEDFLAYATEFADTHGIRALNPRVQTLHHRDGLWWLGFGDELLRAKNVAIAVGLNGAQREVGLPPDTGRAWDYVGNVQDYSRFAGRRVAVIGGGQSGVEAALLAAQAGAETHLVIREDALKFRSLHVPGEWWYRNLFRQSRRLTSWMPGPVQDRMLTYLTAGSAEPETEAQLQQAGVVVHPRAEVRADGTTPARLAVRRSSQAEIPVDYAIVAAGFAYDVRRIGLLANLPIAQRGGFPLLNRFAMSSQPGLFFAGMAALRLLGPQCQFVFGSGLVSPRIIAGVKDRLSK